VRAGGRSERVRQQVAQACLDLLAEGRVDFGHADVASAAGVTRATVYRWWPTKADLLREAVAEHVGQRLEPPDTGTWEGDVQALVANLAQFFRDPVEVGQNALMASGRHPDYNAMVLEHYSPLFDAWKAVIERAQQRGELRDGLDADSILLLLASPLVLVPLLFRMDLNDDDLDRHADLIVAATRRAP
jgi:AcrR family transcriptional regulator